MGWFIVVFLSIRSYHFTRCILLDWKVLGKDGREGKLILRFISSMLNVDEIVSCPVPVRYGKQTCGRTALLLVAFTLRNRSQPLMFDLLPRDSRIRIVCMRPRVHSTVCAGQQPSRAIALLVKCQRMIPILVDRRAVAWWLCVYVHLFLYSDGNLLRWPKLPGVPSGCETSWQLSWQSLTSNDACRFMIHKNLICPPLRSTDIEGQYADY